MRVYIYNNDTRSQPLPHIAVVNFRDYEEVGQALARPTAGLPAPIYQNLVDDNGTNCERIDVESVKLKKEDHGEYYYQQDRTHISGPIRVSFGHDRPRVIALAKPITTLKDLENLIDFLLKTYPQKCFRIEDEFDPEALTIGFLEFQNGKLINWSDCVSMLSVWARVLKYYYPSETIRAASDQANAVKAANGNGHSNYYWREGFSFLFALGASSKQFIGTNNFFAEVVGAPQPIGFMLGGLTSIPAIAFYYRSNTAIAKNWPIPSKEQAQRAWGKFQAFITGACCCQDPRALDADTMKIALGNLFKGIWGDYLTNLQFYEKLTDLVLGTGYGGANLGMVWEAYPHDIDFPVLTEVILFCTFMTNWQVGIDKSHKVTESMIHGVKAMQYPDDEVIKLEMAMLKQALDSYSQMLKVAKKYDGRFDQANAIDELKGTFGDCKTIRDYWRQVCIKINELQATIDAKKLQSYRAALKPGEDTGLLENRAVDLEAATLPWNAQETYFKAEAIFQETWLNTARALGTFGISVAAAGIVSNVGGVSAFLVKAGWEAGIAQIIVSVLLSQGAFGMNLQATDDLKKKILANLTDNLTAEINLNKKSWADRGITPASVAGLMMSALAATQGIYYTKVGFDAMFKSVSDSGLIEFIKYYCVVSTGAMMTITKAGPTGDLFQNTADKFIKWRKGDIPSTANEELTDFQNKTIKILVKGLHDLVVAYNRLINQAPQRFKEEIGIAPINVKIYSHQVNKDLKACSTREAIIDCLNDHLTQLRADFYKARMTVADFAKMPEIMSDQPAKVREQFGGVLVVQ